MRGAPSGYPSGAAVGNTYRLRLACGSAPSVTRTFFALVRHHWPWLSEAIAHIFPSFHQSSFSYDVSFVGPRGIGALATSATPFLPTMLVVEAFKEQRVGCCLGAVSGSMSVSRTKSPLRLHLRYLCVCQFVPALLSWLVCPFSRMLRRFLWSLGTPTQCTWLSVMLNVDVCVDVSLREVF